MTKKASPLTTTTVKLATLTAAAKNDSFASLATEDNTVNLSVLGNDPGSASLYSVWQVPAGFPQQEQFQVMNAVVLPSGASIGINPDGTVCYTAGEAFQHLAEGVVAMDTFTYTVRMANGALSTASVSVEVMGKNDPATIGGDLAGAVAEDGVVAAGGVLAVADVDDGEAVFRTPDAASLAGVYGDFTFDAGAWTYVLRNDAANVQALTSADTVFDSLVVTSLDGTATEIIRVSIAGRDEPVANPVVSFKVNHGNQVSGHNQFHGFDANDLLTYVPALTYKSFTLIDTDGNGTRDSSRVDFQQNGHNGDVSAVLVGYTGFTEAQLSVVL